MADPAKTEEQNILPVQALFNVDNSFNTFIGQGQPFVVSATESIGIQNVPNLNATLYPTFSPVNTGQVTSLDVASTKITFNPYTGVLSVPSVSGNLNGTADTTNNLVGGSAGNLVYQTGTNATGYISNGTTGQVLTSNGSAAPTWTTPTFFAAVTDDTTTNATRYPLFAAQTSGSLTTEYTSSTKYQFNPSTGVLTATQFSGSGAGLTNIPNSALTNSSLTIGSTSISLGSTATTLAGLSSVTSTTFVGNLSGNATSATTSTIATNATNVGITDDTSTSSTVYPTFVTNTTGNLPVKTSSTKLSFVPSTGTLTATNIDNTVIGGTTPAAGTFTNLGVNSRILLNGSAGTSGQVLTSSGAGAPTWTTPTTGTVTSVTGTAPVVSSGGATPVISMAAANTTTNGYLTSTDWNTFNNKGSGSVTSVGGTGTVNGLTLTGTVTTSGNLTLGGTLDLSSPPAIGGTTPAAGTFTTLTANSTFQAGRGSANYQQEVGAATGLAPVHSVQGSDTNISQVFQSKGTGAIDLAAGSSGVNISNGGTVTAITRTSAGSGYTSFPTPSVSVPTTAGGVQAVISIQQMFLSGVTIQSGGTGYSVNDTLTISGGTPGTSAATLTVTTVSAGVITGVTILAGNSYSVLPSNPASVTGGTGSGATFNLTWGVSAGFTITNAGSGYVEQPTVSFSGGGGSGAAAYATVGSIPKVQTLGSALSFVTPGGTSFQVADNGTSNAGYWAAYGGTTAPVLRAITTASGIFQTGGAYPLVFQTNFGTEQLRVAHTASAVNYVQVTGAATTADPVISAQGSDSNVVLRLVSKGSSGLVFQTRGGGTQRTGLQVVDNGASSVNYLQIQSNLTTTAPILSAQGTDTNIDLALTPKGTGVVQFGTYTASALLPVAGYITIKDSGGTTRRLAVV